MSDTSTARHTRLVTVRMTPDEHADALSVAAALGVSVSRLMRSRAEALPPPRADLALASEIQKIGVNVNQIAHQINAGNAPGLEVILPVLEILHGELSELRSQLRRRL